ncbi:cell division protein FtsZ [Acidovorax sp. sic0104]|uniref:cell division protein FtsZ n=1 Tax=Acidovorax sp. sic0104 TaxID=2854784 RepID=UPI001C459E65|nr:cell division protein FtsZ [Acidovorax sp. sic0104]MBV7540310.1 cell division protein FtsZ [Acidovorax sp. sic0104]
MSTLQLSLAIIGGLLLAGIVAYNTWTSRRNAPKRAVPQETERGGAGPVDRLAEPALRQEPGFEGGAPAELTPGELQALDRGTDPSAEHAVDPTEALQMPVPSFSVERRPGLDPLIDVIAPLQPEHVVSGDAALAALPPTRRAGSKPFAIEGLNEATQQWETPAPGQRYQAFQAGVQLANRMGALNEIEFSEFVVKVQAFADAINAAPDFPDMLQEVARARELDQFASDHDAQLAFMLRARQAAWSPGYVQQNAGRLGFVAGAMPGRLVLPATSAAGLPPLLTLGYDTAAALADDPDQSAIRDITLSLDVAQVHRSEQPFARLREVAKALCDAMDGVLCDQNGHPLPAMAMDPITADLELLYDQLDGRDLSAGSVLARRLFS